MKTLGAWSGLIVIGFTLFCSTSLQAITTTKELHQVIKINPTDLRAHLQLGTLHFKARNYRQALKHWIYVARRKPKAMNLRYYIGVAYYRLRSRKHRNKAIRIWQHILKRKINHEKALKALTRVNGKIADKLVHQKNAEAKVDAGKLKSEAIRHRLNGDPLKGAKTLQPLIDEGETSPTILRELAICYLEDGDCPDEAIKYFRLSLDKKPNDLEALVGMGKAFGLKGDFQQQVKIFARCLEMTPDSPELHFLIGLAYDQLENGPKLVHHFQRAVQLDASYKKRIHNVIKGLKLASDLGVQIKEILSFTENQMPSDEQIDEWARRFADKFGLDEPSEDQLNNLKNKVNSYRAKRRY